LYFKEELDKPKYVVNWMQNKECDLNNQLCL